MKVIRTSLLTILIVAVLFFVLSKQQTVPREKALISKIKYDLKVIERATIYSITNQNKVPALGTNIVNDLFMRGITTHSFVDPWNTPYRLTLGKNNNSYIASSAGKDLKFNSDDDLSREFAKKTQPEGRLYGENAGR